MKISAYSAKLSVQWKNERCKNVPEKLVTAFKGFRLLIWNISLFMMFINCFYVYYLIMGKKRRKTLSNYVGNFFARKTGILLCEVIFVLGTIFSPFVFSNFENTNIGSLLEKDTYQEQYYVYIRRNNHSKSYRVKADIFKGNYGYPSYTDEGEETFIIKGNGYFLEKIYWNNGGYLTFSDRNDCFDGASSARLYLGQEARVIDYHDNEYYVTLTSDKVVETK